MGRPGKPWTRFVLDRLCNLRDNVTQEFLTELQAATLCLVKVVPLTALLSIKHSCVDWLAMHTGTAVASFIGDIGYIGGYVLAARLVLKEAHLLEQPLLRMAHFVRKLLEVMLGR